MRCIKCGETDESKFYPSCIKRSDCRCKICVSAYNRQWAIDNPERRRKYSRNYMREYTQSHPEVNKEAQRKWYAGNSELHYERRLAYARANPQRHNAQSNAFRAFPQAQICETEGCFGLGERHHDDYSKPKDIRWPCRKHHKALSRL